MRKQHQEILRLLRNNIIDDMDVYNGIIRPLMAEYILREEDVKQISMGATKEDKAQILLDILPSRGPNAFDIFREALRHHYGWLSEDMDKLLKCGEITTNDLRCYTGSPNLPPLSPTTVIREEKMKKLKNALEKLKPKEYIALHGMKGFGKSCLTASTLKDTKLVANLFYNKVYWITFGYKRPIEEEILIQLNKLYHLVRNIEVVPESLNPEPLKDNLIYVLKHHFSKEDHWHALLILDDVCDKKIIDIFDFECKTLVITADVDLLYEKRPIVIEMNDGFTEAETLGLFAKVLETDVDKLPLEAKRIHEECKGMPLLIAMFSAHFEKFKHDMKLRPNRWRYYLHSLRKKDATNKVIGKFLEKQEAIFDMCIEQLDKDLQKRYEELAIFSEDVNIMPKTLEILWDGLPFQVEDMMLDLCHKSLAAKRWNDGLDSYIYGVHDLLLSHLRKKITPIKLKEMHRSFIEKYRNYCNNDFSKLPEDNYSHSYIGHHLEQAELYDEFPKLYLDFNFIQAKIMYTGLSNLLIDLKNYRKYITKGYDKDYEMKVLDLEKFLEEQASVIAKHRHRSCLDMIQIAMNHPYPGYITNCAKKLAIERPKYLYLTHEKILGQINAGLSEEVSTIVSTSRFTDDPNLILIGNELGEILLWDSVHKKQRVFHGYSNKCSIKKIIVSGKGDCFLTLSDSGEVKLFTLNNDEDTDQNFIHAQSPRQKQTFWSGIFTSNISQDDSVSRFYINGEIILDMTFGDNDDYIAACTNTGTIRVWDLRGNIICNHVHNQHNNNLKNIAFTVPSNLLHIMDEKNGVLITYRKSGDDYNYSKQVRADVENEKTVYVCAALTYDGQYLVLADSSGFINIWNTDVGYQPIATYKSRVTSLDTYWMHEEGYHIICGSENRLLHRWKLPIEETLKSVRKPHFDAVVQPFGKADTVVKETLTNTIVAFFDNRAIAESATVDGRITYLNLSSNGRKIVFVTEKGTVILFDIENNKSTAVFKSSENIKLIKMLTIDNNDVIICREVDNNLKVWQNVEVSYFVKNVGDVISIHEVNEKCVITITQNGIITLWSINGTTWIKISTAKVDNSPGCINFSCLSYRKAFLALLRENQDALVYSILEDNFTSLTQIRIEIYLEQHFTQKITCCGISQNDQYLAVGSENGDISVIDLHIKKEKYKLCFHVTPVTQLHWAPASIDIPVLLSVNADELVWWNIALFKYNNRQKRKSRMGITRSSSTPSTSTVMHLQMTGSQSATVDMCNMSLNLINDKYMAERSLTKEIPSVNEYWRKKEGKDPNRPGLLAVVERPPSCLAKIPICFHKKNMAVVSDAVFSARSPAVSYVSSNAYYGYVPPCRKQNQPDYCFEISDIGDSSAINHCVHGSAMETDDDGCDNSRTSRRLNNHCVIAEATARNRLEIDQREQQNQQLMTCDTGTQHRRNRKRCSTDLAPARELKKFREEAVVTAAFTVVQQMQCNMDWPGCIMRQHHYT
ncbi:hypothetical protein KM043_000802 [Ampulex compressa]|nr:hypothetical protein KM043_000802 [Ampulex compressa]